MFRAIDHVQHKEKKEYCVLYIVYSWLISYNLSTILTILSLQKLRTCNKHQTLVFGHTERRAFSALLIWISLMTIFWLVDSRTLLECLIVYSIYLFLWWVISHNSMISKTFTGLWGKIYCMNIKIDTGLWGKKDYQQHLQFCEGKQYEYQKQLQAYAGKQKRMTLFLNIIFSVYN